MQIKEIVRSIFALQAILLLVAITSTGCKTDNSLSSQSTMTESDAAAIVANSLGSGSSTYGLTGQIEELAGVATGGTLHKTSANEQTTLDTVTVTRQRTGLFSYNYTFRFTYGLLGTYYDISYTMKGTYDTPRMSSDDSAHASFQITNLLSDTMLVNGSYTRLGSQSSKLADQKKFTSEILATIANIKVVKATKIVTGGTVTVTVNGRFTGGAEVSLSGILTYLGNHMATLVINGKTFSINCDTAEVTPA
jgi:hypothetical protein